MLQLGLGVLGKGDVESQEDTVGVVPVGGFEDVPAGDLTDTVLADRDAGELGLVGEGLEGTDGVGLDGDSLLLCLDLDRGLLGDGLDGGILGILDYVDGGAGDNSVGLLAGDLDTCCGIDLLDPLERILGIADLIQGAGLEDGFDAGDKGCAGGTDGDGVSGLDGPGVEDHIERGTETLDLLDLEDGTLTLTLSLLETGLEEALCQTDKHEHEVGHSLSGLGGDGYEGDGLREVLDAVVPVGEDTVLRQLGDDVVHLLLEDLTGVFGLHLLCDDEGTVGLGHPPVEGVDLVEGDDEGGLVLSQDMDGLDGLGHQALAYVDDENGDVRQGTSAGTQRGEGLVSGGVDEQQSGDGELLPADDRAAHLVDAVDGDLGGTDVLRDGSGLAVAHSRAADAVQELGLPVIDMS